MNYTASAAASYSEESFVEEISNLIADEQGAVEDRYFPYSIEVISYDHETEEFEYQITEPTYVGPNRTEMFTGNRNHLEMHLEPITD